MTRIFGLSKNLENNINEALRKFNLTLGDSKVLAKNVMMLSDFFIKNPEDQTPWHEAFAQIAYLCYYLPLNSARLLALIEEAEKRNFFEGMNHVIDFGAGLATASLNLAEKKNLEYTLIERAAEPRKIIEAHFKNFQGHEWLATFNSKQLKNPRSTIALFSYSLTELTELPAWAYDCEALFIVEPSTQQDGRKLLQLREHLLQKGFHVWAPCTHEAPCPLLSRSKNDWCHDRIHFSAPTWFEKMEEHLPMKNRTLTMSYLLMRKSKPEANHAARVVGDRLQEKGKDRQMICRGPDREFLAWMHKNKIEQEIPRGVLIETSNDLQKVSNELRVTKKIRVL